MKPRIVVLYFVMLAGGLWNALGVLKGAMDTLASPLIIALGVWIFIEARVNLRNIERRHARKFIFWALAVMAISIAVEALGVHTGAVFGEYSYGDVLQPQIFGVPLAIGFAWFTMMLSSAAVVTGFSRRFEGASKLVLAVAMAMLMAAFDAVMEPAATALGYWSWQGGTVPALNYITWFALSFVFAAAGLYGNALPRNEFRFGLHAFLAQAAYFILTSAGALIRSA